MQEKKAFDYYLRGHHLMNLKLFLMRRIDDSLQTGFFLGLLSDKKKLVKIVAGNDVICKSCQYRSLDYCSDGKHKLSKEIVAGRDRFQARVFNLQVEEIYSVTYVIESLFK